MKTLLFLCTGNYYRSRYAEILFNHHAIAAGLPWKADSRGLMPDAWNPGPMSRDTMAALAKQQIPYDTYLRLPIRVEDADFQAADHVVAVKELEHRPMMERSFAKWLALVEFWHVDDLDCCGPEDTIPHLDREVAALLDRLRSGAFQPPQ